MNIQENDHVIFKAAFQDALTSIGYRLSAIEFDKLWRRYDTLNSGMVNRKLFVAKITNKSESTDGRNLTSRNTNVRLNFSQTPPEESISTLENQLLL